MSVVRTLDVDYLVVGAGAAGLAFTDALLEHSDARVALVDRRHGVGGHWLEAYPFVRLHQASSFYGVASRVLGDGRLQGRGPEAGLLERASKTEICRYYEQLVGEWTASGRVELLTGCDYQGDREVVSQVSGQRFEVPQRCRVVDARYLAPAIPAETPPRFEVADGARVVPVNDLVRVEDAPDRYVVVGSGKTATDACVWLLGHGVDPDAISWVRPRDPWMLDRALIQPDPAVYLGMVADMWETAPAATSPPDFLLRLEEAGILLRIDPTVEPTMAKGPTLGRWELELLRSVEHVVRRGHVRSVGAGRLELSEGSVRLPADTLVVDCAADGLRNRPLLPIWGAEAITLQPVRAGFPCFGAALIGYVEATRDDDRERNRVCAPSPLGNTVADWVAMNVRGARNAQRFGAEPDVKQWSDRVALNPARVAPERRSAPEVQAAQARLQAATEPALDHLGRLLQAQAWDRRGRA